MKRTIDPIGVVHEAGRLNRPRSRSREKKISFFRYDLDQPITQPVMTDLIMSDTTMVKLPSSATVTKTKNGVKIPLAPLFMDWAKIFKQGPAAVARDQLANWSSKDYKLNHRKVVLRSLACLEKAEGSAIKGPATKQLDAKRSVDRDYSKQKREREKQSEAEGKVENNGEAAEGSSSKKAKRGGVTGAVWGELGRLQLEGGTRPASSRRSPSPPHCPRDLP